MKIATLLLLGIWLHTASFAQQFFNRRLTLNSPSTVLTSVVPLEGKYYCTGICLDSTNYLGSGVFKNAYGIKFAVFDSTGALLNDTFYQEFPGRNLYAWNNNLYMMPDKSFLLAVTNDIDTLHYHMMLLRFDSMGKMIQRYEYPQPFCTDSLFYEVRDIKLTPTGEWLVLGSFSCQLGSVITEHVLLTKLDNNFNVLWEKEFGDGLHNFRPGKLLTEPDGYTVNWGINNDLIIGGSTNLRFRAYIMKTDTAGNKLWDWYSDSSRLTGQPQDIQRTPDGGYIYCGSGDGKEIYANPSTSEAFFRAWVEKLDSNRNTEWSYGFNAPFYDESSVFNVIRQAANGNIFLFGGNFQIVPDPSSPGFLQTNGWMLMLNANGDSLGERIYTSVNSCYNKNVFNDAKPSTDGGFIMVGESIDHCNSGIAPIQRGWIVKVDSNGCLGPNDPQCQPVNVNQPGVINNVFVYPNPAYDVVHVRTGTATGEMQAILSDISGRELKSKALRQGTLTDIELKGLPPGLYLLKVSQSSGAVNTYKVSHY